MAKDFTFERHVNRIESESVEGWADFFMTRFGPLVTAKSMLGDRFAELRQQTIEIWDRVNEAKDGTLRWPQEYLLSIVRL